MGGLLLGPPKIPTLIDTTSQSGPLRTTSPLPPPLGVTSEMSPETVTREREGTLPLTVPSDPMPTWPWGTPGWPPYKELEPVWGEEFFKWVT